MKDIVGVMWELKTTPQPGQGVGVITLVSHRAGGVEGRLQRRYKKLGDYWVPRQYAIDLALALDVPMEEI